MINRNTLSSQFEILFRSCKIKKKNWRVIAEGFIAFTVVEHISEVKCAAPQILARSASEDQSSVVNFPSKTRKKITPCR